MEIALGHHDSYEWQNLLQPNVGYDTVAKYVI